MRLFNDMFVFCDYGTDPWVRISRARLAFPGFQDGHGHTYLIEFSHKPPFLPIPTRTLQFFPPMDSCLASIFNNSTMRLLSSGLGFRRSISQARSVLASTPSSLANC